MGPRTTEKSTIPSVRTLLQSIDGVTVHFDPEVGEASPGRFGCPGDLPFASELLAWLHRHYRQGLFTHQHRALQLILAGEDTVVATRTSSGKSLIYSLPALNALTGDPRATSLFIYPQKALANDQLLKLRQAAGDIPALAAQARGREFFVSRYDGATPEECRPAIREQAQLVLTNPDMLHVSLLQYHDRHWSRLFRHLRYVVVDECHEYRGIFGTNVAYVLRRLLQVCRYHGSHPTLIATSATIRDPKGHMERLTGRVFRCVGPEEDGSLRGRKKFWMVSGAESYYDFGRKLALQLAESGLSVLAFCPGRVAAERMVARVLSARDRDVPYVRVYRAGLSGEEREEIERGLRDKSVRLVFSTSALELGIDIGAIDVVVCIGLPNSMMSLWQRAGRAARAGNEGAIVLIPADTPIDSYYAQHPQELFARDNEPLVLNMTNRRVVCQHYACAVREAGGDEEALDAALLGEPMQNVRQLRMAGKLDLDIFYRADPHMEINVRSIGDRCYLLELGQERIGEIDEHHLLREAYRNAIYRHGGRGYRVKDVIRGKRKVRLEREYSWNETTPLIQKKIRLKRRLSAADYTELVVATVSVDVSEFLVKVVEKDRKGTIVQQWNGNAGMPTHPLPTEGTMLLLRQRLWRALSDQLGPPAARSGLSSCERLLASLFPTVSGPCDAQDFSSSSEILPDGQAAIYLYDLVYDGVDLTTAAFDKMPELIDKALERLTTCTCTHDAGCFRCIANPRIDEPTSKASTAQLLQAVRTVLASVTPRVTRSQPEPAERFAAEAPANCQACGASCLAGDRFCRNCGTRIDD